MSVDDLLRDMRERHMVLTFLQELFNGSWHAAIRVGQQDYERGHGATPAGALTEAIANVEADRRVEFKSIWQAGRRASDQSQPPVAAPPAEADIFG